MSREDLLNNKISAQQYFDAANVIFLTLDCQGHVTLANQTLSTILGYPLKDITGRDWFSSFLPKHSQKDIHDSFQAILTGKLGLFENVEYEILTKDKHLRLIAWHNSLLKNNDGQIIGVLSSGEDITDRRKAEERIIEMAAEWQNTFDAIQEAICILDKDLNILRVNQAFTDMLKVDSQEALGKKHTFLVEHFGLLDQDYRRIKKEPSAEPVVKEVYLAATDRYIEVGLWPRYDQAEKFSGIVNVFRDITERKIAEQALDAERILLRTLIDNLPDSIYVKDRQGRKTLTNPADLIFIGKNDEKDVLGKTDQEIFPSEMAAQYEQDDRVVIEKGQPVINREEIVEDAKGTKRWLLTSKLPLKDQKGKITGLVGIGRDISERKFLEDKLLNMAHYDSLTNLPNRTLFLEKVTMGLAQAKRDGILCAVLFIDLDHFKRTNDVLGHAIGDELLKDTAGRITECIRESDTLARLGGDEFVVFLNGLDNGQLAQNIAERIREKFNVPRLIAGNDLLITASVGIAIYPNDGNTLDDLLKNADAAMYAAKESGRNGYCFFNQLFNRKAVTWMQLDRGLRESLTKKELQLYYQPVVGVIDQKIRGFEVLLRWFKTQGGLILPTEFIPVAEETGMIMPIGGWVLEQACQFHQQLAKAGHGHLIISVNISVIQLRKPGIVETIEQALSECHMPPECLELEVTESILIESFDAALDILTRLRALGVQISLDDFGTGYSSLSHLQRLPISNLKIDRLFIKEMVINNAAYDLTPAIINLAHKLNLNVVAEGVETNDQLQLLAQAQCDFFQGFIFSEPMPQAKVIPFLNSQSKKQG